MKKRLKLQSSDLFEEERVGSGDDGLLLLCDLGGDHPHQRPDHQEHEPQPEAAQADHLKQNIMNSSLLLTF